MLSWSAEKSRLSNALTATIGLSRIKTLKGIACGGIGSMQKHFYNSQRKSGETIHQCDSLQVQGCRLFRLDERDLSFCTKLNNT